MESYPSNSLPLPTPESLADTLEAERQYRILDSPEMRVNYLRLTDELIAKMVSQETDVAVFLDKSARPVAWLTKELWPILAPINPKTGEQFKLPDIKFLNIDREQWGAILGRSEVKEGGINVESLPDERLEELRQVFAPVAGISNEGEQSLLTNKKVMVIDEVKMSGDTLEMSEKILQKAFPDATEIEGAYWMLGTIKREAESGVRVGQEVPVWYSDTVVTGRLVGNRDTRKSMASNSSRQRTGRYWLSAPFRSPDMEGRQLRKETEWLAQDLQEHNVIYMPSLAWDSTSVEPVDRRIERINGISVEQFIELRKATNYDDGSNLVRKYSELMHPKRAA